MKNLTTTSFILTIILSGTLGCGKLVSKFVNQYEARGCKIENLSVPKTALDYIKLANLHHEKSQRQCQFYACQQAVYLDQNDARVYYCRGVAYYDFTKDYPNAITDLTIAIKMQPSGFDGYSYYAARANIHDREEQLDQALADYKKAFEQSPPMEKPYVQLNIAQIYLKQNKLDLALETINQALAQKSDSSMFYFDRAKIYRRQGKKEMAEADQKKANELKEAGK